MIPRFSAYLFDIDGTLVDSAPDICAATGEVLAVRGRTGVPFEVLRSYVGRHLRDLFTDFFPPASEDEIDGMIAEYRTIYLAREHNQTTVFPGVAEALAALGGRKGTATTKGTPTTRQVLEKFALLPYFDHVQGTDGFPAKPAPDVLYAALDGLGAPLEETLFVGDSAADMEAGRRAGIRTCAVRYGYGNAGEMNRFQPDFWIDDLRELS
ncbi:MAG: HAD family hydrolase [Bryobacterales bacterium]|nr:HAD family hydrolase [Bryobacterales bacterium]